MPEISVVMSVYNEERFLAESIESILSQTLQDFEFIIIDDGCTDCSPEIIQAYATKDPRVIFLQNEQNIGLSKSLNRAIQVAQGKYIARMDADDISLPDRLEKQLDFIEHVDNIWVLGTNIYQINEFGDVLREVPYSTNPNVLRWNMLWGNAGVVCHPSVLMKTDKVRQSGLYAELATSQDLELWSRLFLVDPLPIQNMQIPLLKYRLNPRSISLGKKEVQHQVSNQVRLNTLNRAFGTNFPLAMVEAYRTLDPGTIMFPKKDLAGFIGNWFEVMDLFTQKFDLGKEDYHDCKDQLLYRTRTYVSLNPNVMGKNPRLWLPVLLPKLRFGDWLDILFYKIHYRLTGRKD